MIERILSNIIAFRPGKATIILGARQVGKTTLLDYIVRYEKDILRFNGDEKNIHDLLDASSKEKISLFIKKDTKLLVIDEAQKIDNIGLKMKIIIDNFKDLTIILTGSSSFDLKNKVSESLAGRKLEYRLFPFSFQELVKEHGIVKENEMLMQRLIYGSYPEVINDQNDSIRILSEITDSILYKDLLMLEGVKSSANIINLLKALSYQVGSQVSYNELGKICHLNYKTVERYIDILEKCFIVFRVNSYSNNLRNELTKSKKIYFFDNGIRNALISEFNLSDQRQDIGALFENYIISEKMKMNYYSIQMPVTGFWRTKTGAEIDFIESMNGELNCFEIKYNENKKAKVPPSFKTSYKDYNFHTINRVNYLNYLS